MWQVYVDKMYEYLNKIPSKNHYRFRQEYSAQHSLLVIVVEIWRQCLDKQRISGTLLTDPLKPFHSLLHDLLIAKLAAYAFDYHLYF